MESIFLVLKSSKVLESLINKPEMESFLFLSILLGVSLTITFLNSCVAAIWLSMFAEGVANTDNEKEMVELEGLTPEEAVLVVQTAWRSSVARGKLASLKLAEGQKQHAAATHLQALCRGFAARQEFSALKVKKDLEEEALGVIQALHRGFAAWQEFSALKVKKDMEEKSVVVIQCCYRCWKARATLAKMKLNRQFQEKEKMCASAATLIQCWYRCWKATAMLAELKMNREFEIQAQKEMEEQAVTVIQCWYRCCKARATLAKLNLNRQFQENEKMCASATLIQCATRSHFAKKEVAARRLALQQQEAQKQTQAAIKIQSAQRMVLAKAQALGLRGVLKEQQALAAEQRAQTEAAVAVQAVVRGALARQAYPKALEEYRTQCRLNNAASQIQALLRGKAGRRQAENAMQMILRIQRVYRGHRGRSFVRMLWADIDYGKGLEAIVRIQAHIRGYYARIAYMKAITSAAAFDQVFRYDVSVRRLLYGNGERLSQIYQAYVVFPQQAMGRDGAMNLAYNFGLVPDLCTRREFNLVIDEVTKRNKHWKAGDKKILLSFEQYLKLLILLSMRCIEVEGHHTAMHLFEGLLQSMNNSQGFKTISQKRNSKFISRFISFDSVDLPSASEVRNVDIIKALRLKKSGKKSPRRRGSRTGVSLDASGAPPATGAPAPPHLKPLRRKSSASLSSFDGSHASSVKSSEGSPRVNGASLPTYPKPSRRKSGARLNDPTKS